MGWGWVNINGNEMLMSIRVVRVVDGVWNIGRVGMLRGVMVVRVVDVVWSIDRVG